MILPGYRFAEQNVCISKDASIAGEAGMCPKPVKKSHRAAPSSASADRRRTKDELIVELQKLRRNNARLEKKLQQPSESAAAKPSEPTYYDALLKYSADPILVCDKKGLPVLFNEAYKKVMKKTLGITMKAGLQPHKLLPDKKEVAWWDNIHKRVLGGESFTINYSIPVSGVERTFEFSYTPMKEGRKTVGFVEIARDVTERKKVEAERRQHDIEAERAIQESRDRYEMVVNSSPIGITIYDGTGQCIAANQAIADLIGATREQVLAQNFHTIVSWKSSGIYETALSAIRNNRPESIDTKLVSSFGKQLYFSCYLVPFVPDGLLFMAHDLTKQMKTEEELRTYKEQLEELVDRRTNDLEDSRNQLRELIMHMNEQLEEERKRISREVHDELGQLLAAQNIDLTLLAKSDALNDADASLKIESMQALNKQMMTTVKDIVTRLRPPALEILGLADAIRSDFALFEKKFPVSCRAEIRIDESRMSMALKSTLYRMVQECLTNIVRHSQTTDIELRMEQEGSNIRVTLADNGRGLPKLDSHTGESFGVIGMQERVRGLNGEFSIFNNDRGGVTVEVTIPI
jgi:PAS domain S-box-containing protein